MVALRIQCECGFTQFWIQSADDSSDHEIAICSRCNMGYRSFPSVDSGRLPPPTGTPVLPFEAEAEPINAINLEGTVKRIEMTVMNRRVGRIERQIQILKINLIK